MVVTCIVAAIDPFLGGSMNSTEPSNGTVRTERGASSVEYALLAALIAIVIVVAVTAFGSKTNGLFQRPATLSPAPRAAPASTASGHHSFVRFSLFRGNSPFGPAPGD